MPTPLADIFYKVIGRTLIENDTKFQYQLQQVPNPNVPVPTPGAAGYTSGPNQPVVTSPKDTPILEETVIKLTSSWEIYSNA